MRAEGKSPLLTSDLLYFQPSELPPYSTCKGLSKEYLCKFSLSKFLGGTPNYIKGLKLLKQPGSEELSEFSMKRKNKRLILKIDILFTGRHTYGGYLLYIK
jgi:hypothetical protein